MKKVKLFKFDEHVQDTQVTWANDEHNRNKVELALVNWLNDGWTIAGTGGQYMATGFVILVHEG